MMEQGIWEQSQSIQFCDVDIQNRLTMKGALRLMQEAANCHSDQAGYGLNQIEKTDFSWVLHQQRCRLYSRPCWNTKLQIRTWSRGANGLVCLRDFEVLDEAGHLVALASSGWLLVRASTQKLERVPEGMLKKYGMRDHAVFPEPLPRLKPLSGEEKLWTYTVQHRDIVINRHVNNLCYLDYAWEALGSKSAEKTEDLKEKYNEVDILYKKAAYEKDRLACFGGWDKEEEKDVPFTVAVKGEDGKILHAVIRLEC